MFITFVAVRINCQWTLGNDVLEVTLTNINKISDWVWRLFNWKYLQLCNSETVIVLFLSFKHVKYSGI